MRKMLLIASAVTVVAATGAYAIRSTPTAAPEVAPSTSVLEMMSTAKELPVAPTPEAF